MRIHKSRPLAYNKLRLKRNLHFKKGKLFSSTFIIMAIDRRKNEDKNRKYGNDSQMGQYF